MINLIFAAIVLSCLMLSVSSRIKSCIHIVAIQGAIVSLFPLLLNAIDTELLVLVVITISVKAIILPLMLLRSMRIAAVRREVEPLISYPISIAVSIAGLLFSLWIASRLPVSETIHGSSLMIVAPFFMMFTGLFLIVSRTKALTGIMGYLVFENGIYLFGGVLGLEHNFIVEVGILLDVLVMVFVAGVAIFHINRKFDHIDTGRLTHLNEDPMDGER
ncbi:MAG: hypothetical protein PHS31_06420 [Victivallaceae bacterium]|nr:hypothetical protein [Victivallaceae bacterium]MDD4181621.1 hypothetical protein [Victivallaceae bacterium]